MRRASRIDLLVDFIGLCRDLLGFMCLYRFAYRFYKCFLQCFRGLLGIHRFAGLCRVLYGFVWFSYCVLQVCMGNLQGCIGLQLLEHMFQHGVSYNVVQGMQGFIDFCRLTHKCYVGFDMMFGIYVMWGSQICLGLCMYTYIYIYVHICVYSYVYIYIYIYDNTQYYQYYLCVHIHAYMYISKWPYIALHSSLKGLMQPCIAL